MFTFFEVHKNTYPYSTLHVDGCRFLARAKYARQLSFEQVQRLDTIRADNCAACFPVRVLGNQSEYSPAQKELWAIQRAYKADAAAQSDRIYKARKVVALRLALEEAEAEMDLNDADQAAAFEAVDRETRSGNQYALEVTVNRR